MLTDMFSSISMLSNVSKQLCIHGFYISERKLYELNELEYQETHSQISSYALKHVF